MIQRLLRLAALCLLFTIVAAGSVAVWRALRERTPRGDLYAFWVANGAEAWHRTFPGVDPVLALDGTTITVWSRTGGHCAPDTVRTSEFAAATGKPGHGPTGGELRRERPGSITVVAGTVRLRGHTWQAHVPVRAPSQPALLAGDLVIVAVPGEWHAPGNCDN